MIYFFKIILVIEINYQNKYNSRWWGIGVGYFYIIPSPSGVWNKLEFGLILIGCTLSLAITLNEKSSRIAVSMY